MLHPNVLMADIDVDQWRNAQALLLRSAKAARRIVVLHEGGTVLKCRHTQGASIVVADGDASDPEALAQRLYEANAGLVDFVQVMERDAVDSYFAQIQDAWAIDDDLDVFVQKTYASLDDYPEGIVTYPGPARSQLGLQWRIGASREQVEAAARTFVAPNSTAVLGVHRDGALWASLVLAFDGEWKVTSVTTADPMEVSLVGGPSELLGTLREWREGKGETVSFGLVLDHAAAVEFLAEGSDKAAIVAAAVASGAAASYAA